MFPTVPFVKISSPHSPTENWDFCQLPILTTTAASADACVGDQMFGLNHPLVP